MAARKMITVNSAADSGQWWVMFTPEIVSSVARDMKFSATSRQDARTVYVSEQDFPEFKERAHKAGLIIKVDPNIEFHDGWSPIRSYGTVDPTIEKPFEIGTEIILADGRRAVIVDEIEVEDE
jgi:hypothetical protein